MFNISPLCPLAQPKFMAFIFMLGFCVWDASWEHAPGERQGAPPDETPSQLHILRADRATGERSGRAERTQAGGMRVRADPPAPGDRGARRLKSRARGVRVPRVRAAPLPLSALLNQALVEQQFQLQIDKRLEGINAQLLYSILLSLRGVIANQYPF